MITTIYGLMDEQDLVKVEPEAGVVEYYVRREGRLELVHRSSVVRLAGLQATGSAKL